MVKMVNTKNDVRKVRNVRILKIITILSANFYTNGKIGSRYFLFVCPKLPKMIQKFCYLSQRTQRKQNCTYIKMHVRLWDSLMVWEFYSHIHDANEMVAYMEGCWILVMREYCLFYRGKSLFFRIWHKKYLPKLGQSGSWRSR